MEPELLRQLSAIYPAQVVELLKTARHTGCLEPHHARGAHRTANGEHIEFRLRLAGDTILRMQFTFEGKAVLLAASEVACRICEGLTVVQALRLCTEEAIAGELGNLPDSELWSLMQVREALRLCLMQALQVVREPWKGPYVQ